MEQIPPFPQGETAASKGTWQKWGTWVRLNPAELQGLAGTGPLLLSETSIKIAQLWENPHPSGKENTSLAFPRKQSSIKALLQHLLFLSGVQSLAQSPSPFTLHRVRPGPW